MRLRAVSDDTPRFVSTVERAAAERLRHARLLEEGDRRVDPLVVAAFDAEDPVSQAARQLRATLAAARTPANAPLRTVALIGVDTPGETALIAANTAVACAQTGTRTLLIDGAIEAPAQHDLFRIPNRAGLSTLLSAADAGPGTVQTTAIAALSVLTAGPETPNGEQLFDRGRLFDRIRGSMDRYDIAIVLTPADLAAAAAAADGLDGALIVVRRNVSRSRALETLCDRLEERQTPILGLIQVD